MRLAPCAVRRCFRTNGKTITRARTRNRQLVIRNRVTNQQFSEFATRRAPSFSSGRKNNSRRFSPVLPGLKSGARQTRIAMRRARGASAPTDKQRSYSFSYSVARHRQSRTGTQRAADFSRRRRPWPLPLGASAPGGRGGLEAWGDGGRASAPTQEQTLILALGELPALAGGEKIRSYPGGFCDPLPSFFPKNLLRSAKYPLAPGVSYTFGRSPTGTTGSQGSPRNRLATQRGPG